jgi:hypothetical protein
MLKDDSKTMTEQGIKDAAKLMLIGSTINEVMTASAGPVAAAVTTEEKSEGKLESI